MAHENPESQLRLSQSEGFGEHEKNTLLLAALETIRFNQFIPFNLHKRKAGSLSTTSEKIELDPFEPGFIYIITTITGAEIGTGTPQIKIGLISAGIDMFFKISTVGSAENSVEYVGQIMAKETDKVFATFESAVAADTIHLNVSGYKIRR